MPALLHSIIDRGEYEKYLFLPVYGNTENPPMTVRPQDRLVTVKRWKGNYTLFSVLSNNLQNNLSQMIAY